MLVIVVAFGVTALARGQDISRVGLNGEIGFYPRGGSGETSPDVRERQESLDDQVSEREKTARDAGGGTADAGTADLSGSWTGANGLTYVVEQFGTEAVMTEMGGYGVTAYAYGTVTGGQFRFQFEAFDGTVGDGSLTLVESRTLKGSFTSGGSTLELRLTR